MRFRLLGSTDASVGDTRLALGPQRQLCVFAVLLVEANTAVPVDVLVERVWGGTPPLRARVSLQSYLTRLRAVLAAGEGATIVRRNGSYLLDCDQQDIDLFLFRDLVARSRASTDAARALVLLEQALALWRGEPFAGLDCPWLQGIRVTLDVELLAAQLDCADHKLALGRHAELLAPLAAQVRTRPMDERLVGQLMLALYRSGRQADALTHYQLLRDRIADELGLDPGPRLRQLHQQILTADHALAHEVRQSEPAIPRQLPPTIADFTAREAELARIGHALTTVTDPYAVRVVAVSGIDGVGKSALAIRAAHQLADTFPDGQLYADLRDEPPTETERAEVHRSRLADRRMLIVLDNVVDERQVASLLPGSPGCAVLITSTRRLTGLPGAHLIDVAPFDAASSIELVSRIIGADRVAAEPGATAELAHVCAHLPLALRIAGARLAARPHRRIADLVRRLVDRPHPLDEFAHHGLALRPGIAAGYLGLDDRARLLFRRCALLLSIEFADWTAAALLDTDQASAEDALDRLVDARLLDVVDGSGVRYRFAGLTRRYAHERLVQEETEADRRACLGRVLHSRPGLAAIGAPFRRLPDRWQVAG